MTDRQAFRSDSDMENEPTTNTHTLADGTVLKWHEEDSDGKPVTSVIATTPDKHVMTARWTAKERLWTFETVEPFHLTVTWIKAVQVGLQELFPNP